MPPKAKSSKPAQEETSYDHWLMKAEPDTRIVKGKDVKFSIDDLEDMGSSPWDGVRNHEAKKIMKEKMKLGHKVLFYHSNTKTPGIFGTAEVSKEGYPDPSAVDASHPYHDPKSNSESPTWFCTDISFCSKFAHPVTLPLLKLIASLPLPSTTSTPSSPPPPSSLPDGLQGLEDILTSSSLEAIKGMALINRGRLSVQPVEEKAFRVIVELGQKGGWSDEVASGKQSKAKKGQGKEAKEAKGVEGGTEVKEAVGTKRKKKDEKGEGDASAVVHSGLRRSGRTKKA